MKKAMVYFEDKQYYGLKQKAAVENRTFADVVREGADLVLSKEKKKRDFSSLIGMFSGPADNASERVDEILEEHFRTADPHD